MVGDGPVLRGAVLRLGFSGGKDAYDSRSSNGSVYVLLRSILIPLVFRRETPQRMRKWYIENHAYGVPSIFLYVHFGKQELAVRLPFGSQRYALRIDAGSHDLPWLRGSAENNDVRYSNAISKVRFLSMSAAIFFPFV